MDFEKDEIAGDLVSLDSQDRQARKRALERLWKRARTSKCPQLRNSIALLAPAAFDSQESCRELTIKILAEIVRNEAEEGDKLDVVLSTLVQRLGVESSEEIRLLLVTTINDVLRGRWKDVEVNLESVVEALGAALLDQYPEVKKEACACVCTLAQAQGGHFQRCSEALVDPLIRTLEHRHSKVRVSGLDALGETILRGTSKPFVNVWQSFAQRLLDPSPIVRRAVIKIAGEWISEWTDRRSYYPQLICLILSGLSDDNPDVQQLAVRIWHEAGRQYERENEIELQQQLEYEKPVSDGYPGDLVRSPLGCRALVRRNASCLLTAVFNDLRDWKEEARFKAAQLLHRLLLHLETDMTQHVPTIVDGMLAGCDDGDSQIAQKLLESAGLVGYVVPARVWHPIILDKLASGSSVPKLKMLAAMLRGCLDPDLWSYGTTVAAALLEAASDHMQSTPHQAQILECAEAMLKSPGCPDDTRYPIFQVLLTLFSSGNEFRDRIYSCFDQLSLLNNIDSRDQLFAAYGKDIVAYLVSGRPCTLWNVHSSQFLVFKTFLVEAGRAMSRAVEDVSSIIAVLSGPDKDVELKFYLFQAISHLSEKLIGAEGEDFAVRCLRECVLPNLDWRPGKSESVLRAAALSCLHCLLQRISGDRDEFLSVFEDVLSKSIGCLVDGHGTTRRVACEVLDSVMWDHSASCEGNHFRALSSKLAERLDDTELPVRLAACQALGSCLRSWRTAGTFDRAHLEPICGKLMLYLDDPEVRFQSAALETLKIVSSFEPAVIGDLVEKAREKQENQEHLEALTRCLEDVRLS